MSIGTNGLLGEFNKLQDRLDELRVLLRREIAGETLPEEPFKVLLGRTDEETIGILIQHVIEVLPICRLTSIPDAPPWMAGLMNMGGEMIPVVDLSLKISKQIHTTNLGDLIIVCKVDDERVGFIVNEVFGIERLTPMQVQTVSGELSAAPYLLGAAEVNHQTVLILNVSIAATGLGLSKSCDS